jgi:type II secretory pathway pseudopilin PulG
MRKIIPQSNPCAFSLVELLVLIGAIGIISAIAIPSISNIWAQAKDASSRRNAQQAVSLSRIADSAGLPHVVPENAGGIKATLEILAAGISGISNTGIPVDVQLPLNEEEIDNAVPFLFLRSSGTEITLEYSPNY